MADNTWEHPAALLAIPKEGYFKLETGAVTAPSSRAPPRATGSASLQRSSLEENPPFTSTPKRSKMPSLPHSTILAVRSSSTISVGS